MKLTTTILFLLIGTLSYSTSYTWTGATNTNWSNSSNWSPNGVPDLGDDVILSNQTNNPILDQTRAIQTISMSSGTLNLAGFILVVHGSASYSGGTVSNGTFLSLDATAINADNYSSTTFDVTFNSTASILNINSCIFNESFSCTYNGTTNNNITGGNVFNDISSFTNTGSGRLRLSNNSGDTYNGDTYFSNDGTNRIDVAHKGVNTFNSDLYVSSTDGSGIRFSQNTGSSILASGKRILTDGAFSTGDLRLKNFTQSGTTTQSLTFTGDAIIFLQTGTTFNGNLTYVGPRIRFNGSTFNGDLTITKNSTGNDTSTGGNTFNGNSTFNLSGAGRIRLANTLGDTFNGDCYINVTGANRFEPAYNSSSIFNGDIYLNSSASSTGIRFGQGTGTTTINPSNIISISGFSTGNLYLKGIDYQNTSDLILNITNNLYLQAGNTFECNLTTISGRLYLHGGTFNGTFNGTKNGTSNDSGDGSCVFNDAVTLNCSGSGDLKLANTFADTFNSTVSLISNGTGRIELSNSNTNQFNGNITLESTGSSDGIRFGNGGGSSNMASGVLISISGSGFSSGNLYLYGITQETPDNYSLSTTGSSTVRIGGSSVFDGTLTVISPGINLNGATFNNTLDVTKNGSSTSTSLGGNIFNGNTFIRNAGSNFLRLSNSSPDIFNSNTYFLSTGSSRIEVGHGAGITQLNETTYIGSSGTSTGIRFGNGAGSVELADGKIIEIDAIGFSIGSLFFTDFTQIGTTSQSFSLSGTAYLDFNSGCTFNAPLNIDAPQLKMDGGTFNNTVELEKTGDTNNTSLGGNTFENTTIIKVSGNGRIRMANTSGDDFNGDITFVRTGSGTIQPAFNNISTFSKDIIITTTGTFSFGAGNGTVELDGSLAQSITSTNKVRFTHLDLSSGSGLVSINKNVDLNDVTSVLTLGNRFIDLGSKNLTIDNEATSAISYTNGYIITTGTITWTMNSTTGNHSFPLGSLGGNQIPLDFNLTSGNIGDVSISHYSTIDANTPYPSGVTNMDTGPGTDNSANCLNRFWQIDVSGSGSTDVTFTYADADIPSNGEGTGFRAQRWNSGIGQWDQPIASQSYNTATNTVSVSGITNFSPWALAKAETPLPIELISFSGKEINGKIKLEWLTASEINNDYFELYKMMNDEFILLGSIAGNGNSIELNSYEFIDYQSLTGNNLYQLKQIDFDGTSYDKGFISINTENNKEETYVIQTSHSIELQSSSKETMELRIYDLQGKLIHTSNYRLKTTIHTKNFNSGLYLILVKSRTDYFEQKVIIRN